MNKRARLKDIADALNISIATVSRAINGKSDISKETKDKILKMAKMLEYKPNYFAKYMNSDSGLIGLIIPRVAHSFYSQMVQGIMQFAQENGHFLIIGESMDDAEIEKKVLDDFRSFNVKGILVAPASKSILLATDTKTNFDSEKIVLLDRAAKHNKYWQVTNDHKMGAKISMEHLYDQGYRRIAHIRGPIGDYVKDELYHGYHSFIQSKNLPELVFNCTSVNPESGYEATEFFLKNNDNPPDAIFSVSDEAALGIYRYCYENNLRIPDDIAVLGYSGSQISQYLTPSLSTISQHSRDMGIHGLQLIIDGDSTETNTKVFLPTLVARESTEKK